MHYQISATGLFSNCRLSNTYIELLFMYTLISFSDQIFLLRNGCATWVTHSRKIFDKRKEPRQENLKNYGGKT